MNVQAVRATRVKVDTLASTANLAPIGDNLMGKTWTRQKAQEDTGFPCSGSESLIVFCTDKVFIPS